MSVEVYAIVSFDVPPLSQEEKNYMKHEGYSSGEMKVERVASFHFCKCKLIQPTGKNGSVPHPKWEIVEDHEALTEQVYDRGTIKKHLYLTLEAKPHDPYGDCWTVYKGDVVRYVTGKANLLFVTRRMPNYQLQWEDFFKRNKSSHPLTPSVKFLPLHHPIDDRRIQLKQIRYLYPETAKMPLLIALDYVRDKL